MNNLKQPKGLATFKAGCIATCRAIQDKIFQVVLKGMSLLEATLMQHKETQIEGSFPILQKQALKELILLLGDNNPRLRERAEDLLFLLPSLKIYCSPNQVINLVIKDPIEPTKPKLVIGRMQLLVKLLQKYPVLSMQGQGSQEQLVAGCVRFAVAGLKHQNADVRQQSNNIIQEIYKVHGASIKPLLKDLRIAQLEMLDKAFQQIDNPGVQTSEAQGTARRNTVNKFGSFKMSPEQT